MKYSINQTSLISKIVRSILFLFAISFALSLGTQIQAATLKEYNPVLEILGSTQAGSLSSPTQTPLDELVLSDVLGVQSISTSHFVAGATTVRNAGANFVHMGIEWRWLSDNLTPIYPDSYDWAPFDSALSEAAARGYKVLITLGGNPYWAADFNRGPINKVPMNQFTDYVSAVVTRYSAPPYNVEYWAFYNEPDVVSFDIGLGLQEAFGDHPQDYVDTLHAGFDTVKGIDPNATVFMGGIAFDGFTDEGGVFNKNFLDEILTLGAANYFDVMNFHYYPDYDSRWEGLTGLPGLMGKTSEVLRILSDHSVVKPIICSELGASSGGIYGGDPRTEDTQSQEVVKYFSRAIAAGNKIGIWYNMNDYASANDPFRNHGLLEVDYDPKPSLSALQTLAGYLADRFFLKTMASSEWGVSSLEGYIFRATDGVSEVAVIWTKDSSTQIVTLPEGVTSIQDKYGNPKSIGSTLSIDGDPTYVVYAIHQVFHPQIMK